MHPAARRILLWAPPLLYMALIFWMSSRSDPLPGVSLSGGRDKVAHAVAYAVLGALLARAFLSTWPDRPPARMAALAAAVATFYGVLDEVHQSFVPGRHAEVLDVVADAVGAVAGAALFFAWHRRLGGRPAE